MAAALIKVQWSDTDDENDDIPRRYDLTDQNVTVAIADAIDNAEGIKDVAPMSHDEFIVTGTRDAIAALHNRTRMPFQVITADPDDALLVSTTMYVDTFVP